MRAPVDRIVELVDADGVLGLGEPTHGSANAFDWRFDVICELAARGLLSMLAFEDSYVVGTAVDAALREDGDIAEPWADAMSVWRTRRILEGLRRLQRIDAPRKAEAKTRFLGVDSKRPHLAARALLAAGYASDALESMAGREELDASGIADLQETARCAADSADPGVAPIARQILRYVDAYLLEPDFRGLHRRDTHMAQTLLEHRPSRGITVLWAHNEHVARNPDNFGGPSTGQVLAEQLGPRYTAIGMLCGEGTCRAVDPSTGDHGYRTVALPPAHPRTTDSALGELGTGFVSAGEFSHPGPRRFIGWRVDSSLPADHVELQRPSSDCDALAYLPSSIADIGLDDIPSPAMPESPHTG